jgi:hypothetical protein
MDRDIKGKILGKYNLMEGIMDITTNSIETVCELPQDGSCRDANKISCFPTKSELKFEGFWRYLFIYSLFNDAFSISDYITSNERMIVNNELERMWNEVVVA